ncbi:MAG: AIR synthase-related protein [Patescibacteria group bacterium]
MKKIEHVNYDILDKAKAAFIVASQRTVKFAGAYGFIPESGFGSSANVFTLDLKPFLKAGAESLSVTLLPEGLGTSDDARPEDLSTEEALKFWHNIGIKTVAVMTNDAAASGLQTILISLYLPSSTPEIVFNETFMKGFLDGFVAGCEKVGCVYFSGETPQLKGKILEGKLDIAGALFGICPPGKKPIDSSRLSAGDQIVFIESSGPHDNGFTTLRKLAADLPQGYRTKLPDGRDFYDAMNAPTILYTPFVQNLLRENIDVTNIEPITGHGWQKLMRSKKNLRYVIETMLPVPAIFEFVERHANISKEEMMKIFNYGVGMAVFTPGDGEKIVEIAKKNGLNAVVAGVTEASERREVFVKPLGVTLTDEEFLLKK